MKLWLSAFLLCPLVCASFAATVPYNDGEASVESVPPSAGTDSAPFFYASATASSGAESKSAEELPTENDPVVSAPLDLDPVADSMPVEPANDDSLVSGDDQTEDASLEELLAIREGIVTEIIKDMDQYEELNRMRRQIVQDIIKDQEYLAEMDDTISDRELVAEKAMEGDDDAEERNADLAEYQGMAAGEPLMELMDELEIDPLLEVYEESSRKRRSLDDYWYDIGEPSKHLEKYNVGYRIKNDLRKRLENDLGPLHHGYIKGFSNDYDRTLGYHSDFDLYHDLHAFKKHPHGPRLGKRWMRDGWPIYAYSLYKLREPIRAQELTYQGPGDHVWIKSGLYRFIAAVEHGGDIMIENVKTKERFYIAKFMVRPDQSRKFQAYLPIEDPQGKYIEASNPHSGSVYMIRATPYVGQHPARDLDFLKHKRSKFSHLKGPGSILDQANVVKKPVFIKH